jgi:hypothetical protein
MKCTFCGSGNRPENRFCGMCGVRIERRQQERRTSQTANLSCADCNHVNEAGHKFCGMCGTRIERRVKERRGSGMLAQVSAGEGLGRAVAQANAKLPSPEMHSSFPGSHARAAASAPAVLNQMERAQTPGVVSSREYSSPTIGGPSFLGLSSEPQGGGEYLLEDETSSRSGLRKLVLLVVLLAIGGLIFVQWRDSHHASPKALEPPKPEPATVPHSQGKNQPPSGSTQGNENAKNNTPAGIDPKIDPDTKPKDAEGDGKQDARAKTTVSAGQVAGQSSNEEKQVALKKIPAQGTSAGDAQGRDSNAAANDDANDEGQGRTDVQQRSRAKPSVALIRAQRYLQGRGVHQNCEQGMMYLKAATQQNDPSAAVQMAALYASGHCVPQDRVKAYQWFASAFNQEPGNQWIAKNMNQLWGQMTPQQRRQFQ